MRQVEHHEHRPLPGHGRRVSLALADVKDPLNVGHAFRLGASLGVDRLYLLGETPAPPNAKLNRTARGAQHQVTWESRPTVGAWARFRADGLRVVAVEYATASRDIRAVRRELGTEPVVLAVGNEAHGFPSDLLDEADAVAQLPMFGAISSFNVSTALAIALWEWVR